MNFPTNLLFDVEIAKSRLREVFEPAPDPDRGNQRKRSVHVAVGGSVVKEDSVAGRFAVPEVNGCMADLFSGALIDCP
jgi:hypothetical protein